VCKARLVHRQEFVEPEAEAMVEELSFDGGNKRKADTNRRTL
jgi:hypothetical protein